MSGLPPAAPTAHISEFVFGTCVRPNSWFPVPGTFGPPRSVHVPTPPTMSQRAMKVRRPTPEVAFRDPTAQARSGERAATSLKLWLEEYAGMSQRIQDEP